MDVLKEEFVIDLLTVCSKHGIVPDTAIRNFKVKQDYKKFKAEGMTGKDSREKLSEKYFTSEKNIEFILYGKKNNSDKK